jgi:hypothetical protein
MLHEFSVPFVQNNRQFYNIVAGPDGNLWYTDSGACRICAITTNGAAAVFPLAPSTEPFDIIVGPDQALWFTEFNAGKIGRLTTNCFTSASFTTTGKASTNIVTKGVLTEIYVPTTQTAVQPYGLTIAPSGSITNIWFADFAGNTIDRITRGGGTNLANPNNYFITQFPTPTSGSQPTFVASGRDLNLWFGESANNAVGILVLDHFLSFNVTNIVLSQTNFSGTLATFHDIPYNAFATNYSASVNWGDGTTNFVVANSTPGTKVQIVANASGGFKVITASTHHFPSNNTYAVTITVTNQSSGIFDAGGAVGSADFTISTTLPVPSLSIAAAGSGQMVFSWTTAATNFVLQINTNLSNSGWVNVTNPPVKETGGHYTLTNTASGNAFYRLKAE